MSTPKTIAFYTLGCKLNFSETSSIARRFEERGYTAVPFEQGADIYLINTCSVTDMADRKCRKVVRRALRLSPNAKVVVTGCYAQLKPEEIVEIPGVDLVLGAAEKFKAPDYVEQLEKSPGKGMIRAGELSKLNTFEPAWSFGDRTRSFLKIQDGCDYKCTFCTIPKARGKSRSSRVEDVVRAAEELAASGVREIVLTGVNIGDFGNGTEVIEGRRARKEALFSDLIAALDEVEGIARYRISSIEPNLCTDEIISFVASSKRFAPHFHIPLQSGSDKILRLMRRRYVSDLYAERVAQIKSLMPHACIGVDVISGFPGESEEDFLRTYEFLRELDISYLHAFTYSERSGTPAVDMPGRVSFAERQKRTKQLQILSEKKRRLFYEQHLGQSRPVLFEHNERAQRRAQGALPALSGFTDNYIRTEVPAEAALAGRVVEVRLASLEGDVVQGELLETVDL